MATRTILAALVACAAWGAVAQAGALQTFHAGEWEGRIDGGTPHITCLPADRTFDQATFSKIMALSGAKCATGTLNVAGAVISFSASCDIAGGHLTVFTTITATGPDAYTTRSRSHYVGGQIKMPDMDITETSRRLGACKPGDKPSPF